MIDFEVFVQDNKTLQEYWRLIQNSFITGNRLPQKVFNDNFTNFLIDDNWAFSSDFWQALQASSLNKNNELITVASLDPLPEDYFQNYSHYNMFRLPMHTSPQKYQDILNIGLANDSFGIMSYSNIAVWIPQSLDWAIYQSSELELCIIGFNKLNNADKIPLSSAWWPVNNNWMSIEEAIANLLPQIFRGQKVPKDLADMLCQNYMINK